MPAGYRSSSNTGGDVYVTSIDVPVPAGAAAADIALVALGQWDLTAPAVTPPAGFTEFVSVVSGNLKLKVFWKRLTGGDTGDYTFSWSGQQWSSAQAMLVTGALSTGGPVTVSNTVTATGTTVASTSVTTGFGPLLAHFCYNENSTDGTPPTGFTEVQDEIYGKTSYQVPGTTGTHTASGGTLGTSTLHHVALIAVEPAAVAGLVTRPVVSPGGAVHRAASW